MKYQLITNIALKDDLSITHPHSRSLVVLLTQVPLTRTMSANMLIRIKILNQPIVQHQTPAQPLIWH